MGGRRRDGRSGVSSVLSPRQEAFCQAYIVCGGAEQAMIRAGYAVSTSRHVQHQLLDNMRIQARIQALRDRAAAPVVAKLTAKILTIEQRKARLSEIAMDDRRDRVPAIGELNKMTVDAYPRETGLPPGAQLHIHIECTSEQGRELTRRLVAGEGPAVERERTEEK